MNPRGASGSGNARSTASCRLPRCICGCDQLSRTDIDRYTDRLQNVLNCSRGRNIFRQFLENKGFTEAMRALQFWELSEQLNNSSPSEDPQSQLGALLSLAEDLDDIDFAAIERLNCCKQSGGGDVAVRKQCLQDTQTLILNSMRDEYVLFCDYLLEKRQR